MTAPAMKAMNATTASGSARLRKRRWRSVSRFGGGLLSGVGL
jgi:hypothetical protein